MSLQAALDFIHLAREDEALRGRLGDSASGLSIEDLTEIGAQAGFHFSVEELRTAFKHDWRMRWMHYRSRSTG